MQRGTIVGPIIVAISVVIAAMAFAIVSKLLETADGGTALQLSEIEAKLAALTDAQKTGAMDLDAVDAAVAQLRADMTSLANRAPMAQAPVTPTGDPSQLLPDEDFENPVETADPHQETTLNGRQFNKGITQPRNKTMQEILGPPRDSYSSDCQSVTNPRLLALLEERQVGPIRVRMLKPALDSLERILNRLKESDPDIYAKFGTAGALCARYIRGSTTSVSNHSWGSAIDVTLQGELDLFADGNTQAWLVILAELFND